MALHKMRSKWFSEHRKQWVEEARNYQGNHISSMLHRHSRDTAGNMPGWNFVGLGLRLIKGLKQKPRAEMMMFGEKEYTGNLPPEAQYHYGLFVGAPKVVAYNEVHYLQTLEGYYGWSLSDLATLLENQDESWDGTDLYCRKQLESGSFPVVKPNKTFGWKPTFDSS